MVIVVLCVMLDHIGAVEFGYGLYFKRILQWELIVKNTD